MQARRVAVVGGGLGGLAAAALLARGGWEVTLYERSKLLGGRAHTSDVEGFRFNLGPHALYRGGAGLRVLGSLGLHPKGGVPGPGSYALREGRLHTLPSGPVSLLTTDLLGLAGKLEFARALAGLGRMDAESFARLTTREWIDRHVARAETRALLAALVRVSTYCADVEALSAEVAVSQLQSAISKNVLYVDGGWSTLVEALEKVARDAGVRVESSARVDAVVPHGADGASARNGDAGPGHAGERGDHPTASPDAARVRGVRLADGTVRDVDAVVVAAGPGDVAALLPGDAVLARWAKEAVPVKAATLELGLARLPRPHASFALGIDGPWYVSVHSAYAKLAPEGGAMVHVAKYLGGADTRASEAELEAVMDALQPGWRAHVVARRYRPSLTVSHALPRASEGGFSGRPGPAVPHLRGLYVVGDWVGAEGLLADASLASAEATARLLLRETGTAPGPVMAAPRRAVGA